MVCVVSSPARRTTLNRGTESGRKPAYHLLTLLRAVRGLERHRALSPAPKQPRFLRRLDPAILCGANILERGLGYFRVPLGRHLVHLGRAHIDRFPEIGQPLEPIRVQPREPIVLGPSKALLFDGKPSPQCPRADKPQRYGFIRIASCAIERVDVPAFRVLDGSVEPTCGETGMRSRFNMARHVQCGGREEGPLHERRVSILRRAVACPFSGPVISSEWVNNHDDNLPCGEFQD